MKRIKLTQNQYALVDDGDYAELNQWKWQAHYNPHTKSYYTVRTTLAKNGKRKQIGMHRIILNAPKNMQVDHINHNTLDNRKQNLRLCTQSQNQMNQARHKKTLSKYKGVDLAEWKYKNKVYQYWRARIQINGKPILLGLFKSEIQASRGYDKAAKELFGEFAFINFKEEIK